MPEQKLPYIVSQFDIEHETTETQVQPVIYREKSRTWVLIVLSVKWWSFT